MASLPLLPKDEANKLSTKGWYLIAESEGWTNEELGRQIIEAAKDLND
tara:strand:+ start:590 stop:733 length:144 start_codon:yes stop_codon:yes gene_type:complete